MAIRSQTQRGLLLAFIASLAACALMGIYALLVGQFGWFELRILASTATLACGSILGLASAAVWESRRWHPIGPVGLAAILIAVLLLLLGIWEVAPNLDAYWKSTACAIVLSVAAPHVGLLGLARLARSYEPVRVGAVVAIGCLAAAIITVILAEPSADLWARLIGILGIVVACGTVSVPILHRVSAIRSNEQVVTTELRLSMTCPRCRQSSTIPAGKSKCPHCGLRITIEIEEEHCRKCGYSLYRLTSAACPECGTPIAAPAPSQ